MIFETHAHYDGEEFEKDRDELLQSMPREGIGVLVNVSEDLTESEASVNLSEKYPYIFAAVGTHPEYADTMSERIMTCFREMAARPKTVAIGEIGLDYHYDDKNREVQKEWFGRQIELAGEVGLPIVVHTRDAAQDTMTILKEHEAGKIGGVIHCYPYSAEQAKEYVKMGFFLGIGGVLTFKNSKKIKEVVSEIPLESLVLETDSPFLSPEPFRGKRNDSRNLKLIAQTIGKLKGISEEEVERVTWENAMRLYPKVQNYLGEKDGESGERFEDKRSSEEIRH